MVEMRVVMKASVMVGTMAETMVATNFFHSLSFSYHSAITTVLRNPKSTYSHRRG